jgi:hypothetical protein
MKWFVLFIAVVGLIGGVFIYMQSKQFELPKGGETVTETIVIEDGQVVDAGEVKSPPKENSSETEKVSGSGVFQTTKEIMITDGVKHSIPLDELIGGGPSKDGIPSIDNPKFVKSSESDKWLDDSEPGIALSKGNTNRFYPYQILVWNEIVNDTVEGERVLVSYCPLCLSGVVFDPLVNGERVEFGTSGKLWHSNLVMYDRKTDSLWPQVLGEAVVGEMTGTKLKILPSDQVRYGDWKKKFPEGEILSRDTGTFRSYGTNPYGDYFAVTNLSLSLTNPTDTRLPNDALILGIVVNGKAKAYSIDSVKKNKVVQDVFEGKNFTLRYDEELDVTQIFEKFPNGAEERFNPFSAFWFSWASAHPDTEVYK